jgi:phage baseplate assembly protein W
MDSGQIYGQGIRFPPNLGPDGRLAWSVGEANVREAIQIILLTERNERITLPEFGGGLGSFLFEPNTVTTYQLIRDRIMKALTQWEPRIMVQSVAVGPDPSDPGAAVATITYLLVATQSLERVGINVTLSN